LGTNKKNKKKMVIDQRKKVPGMYKTLNLFFLPKHS
jgi:hypothetical protein